MVMHRLNKAPQGSEFKFIELGESARDAKELYEIACQLDEIALKAYLERGDFSSWAKNVLCDDELSKKLAGVCSKQELVKIFEKVKKARKECAPKDLIKDRIELLEQDIKDFRRERELSCSLAGKEILMRERLLEKSIEKKIHEFGKKHALLEKMEKDIVAHVDCAISKLTKRIENLDDYEKDIDLKFLEVVKDIEKLSHTDDKIIKTQKVFYSKIWGN